MGFTGIIKLSLEAKGLSCQYRLLQEGAVYKKNRDLTQFEELSAETCGKVDLPVPNANALWEAYSKLKS